MNKVEKTKGKKLDVNGNILIIEDNKNCCFLIKEYLDLMYDLNSINISNEFEPNKIIKNSSNIKLILINYKLIKSYNYGLIKEIQKNIPIIAITSDNSNKTMEKIRSYGFNDIILKPILARELISKVSGFL